VLVGPALIPARETELAERAPLAIDLAGVDLLGYRLDQDAYATGERADLALFLQPRGQLNPAAHLAAGWQAADGAVIWTEAQPLAGAGRSAEEWRVGELLEMHYLVPVPDALSAGQHTLVINLQVGADGPHVLPQDTALATAPITPLARVYDPPSVQFAQRAVLGDLALLWGYDLPTTEATPGGDVALTLYWQALGDAAPFEGASGQELRDLVVFVQLLDASGVVRGQVDAQPAAGARPTLGWAPGEFITDAYTAPLDADAPPGVYRVVVGLYDPETMQRVLALDASGQRWPDDAVVLETAIRVE